MPLRRRVLLASTVLMVLASTACGSAGARGTPGAGEAPSVVTALYPLAFVAERVGGDDIALTNLAAPGVEPHDSELEPRQVGAIANASMIIYLAGFAPAVDEALHQNAEDRGLDVASLIPLREATDDDHAHDNEDAGDEDDPAGGVDPHFWLDPHLLAEVAAGVADRLAEIDPDHTEGYVQRAEVLIRDLDELDHEFEVGLETCDTNMIVTAHAAFAYLAGSYGLEQFSVAGLEPDAEPSAARIAEVQEEITTHDVTTVYFEPLTSGDVVDAIATDLGLETAELDPIESVSDGDDYLTVMARDLATLRDGQGCA